MPPAGRPEMPKFQAGVMERQLQEMDRLEAQQQMGGRAFARRRLGNDKELREQLASIVLPPIVVREYAHVRSHGVDPSQRHDATETVYWNPVLVMADGKAEAAFDLSDQVTSFEVIAYGHTLDGRLGTLTHTLESRIPLAFEAKTPIEVTASDKIDLPLAISNNTDKARAVNIHPEFSGLALIGGEAKDQFQVQR